MTSSELALDNCAIWYEEHKCGSCFMLCFFTFFPYREHLFEDFYCFRVCAQQTSRFMIPIFVIVGVYPLRWLCHSYSLQVYTSVSVRASLNDYNFFSNAFASNSLIHRVLFISYLNRLMTRHVPTLNGVSSTVHKLFLYTLFSHAPSSRQGKTIKFHSSHKRCVLFLLPIQGVPVGYPAKTCKRY